MTERYNGLAPGVYLQVGDQITAIKSGAVFDPLRPYAVTWGQALAALGQETAGIVSWVFIAQEERKDQLAEIPFTWLRNDEEMDGQPYGLDIISLSQRIDEAIQGYGEAFLLKQRAGNGGLLGLRWLDPSSMQPDYRTADPVAGIKRYKRNQNGKETYIPAEDVIHFARPGMDELKPGDTAGMATRYAARILRGIEQTTGTFYANNALPVTIIEVPDGTPPAEVERVESSFRRLFNGRRGTHENRVRGVRAGIKLHKLGMTPAELGQGELTEQKRDEILAAYGVPKQRVLSDAANYATDLAATRRFVQRMGASFQLVADALNSDVDIESDGFVLRVDLQSHQAMREDEARRAQSVAQYVAAGLTIEAALYLAGISVNDFPVDMQIFQAEPGPVAVLPAELGTPQAEQDTAADAQAGDVDEAAQEAKTAELARLGRWLDNRETPNPYDFKSDVLDGSDIAMAYVAHLSRRHDSRDAFFWGEEAGRESYP